MMQHATGVSLVVVLIVAEVKFYREGLELVLPKSGDILVVASAESAAQARGMSALGKADVVLLDPALPGARELLAHIRTLPDAPRVIALAISETPPEILSWAEAGVSGYVPRSASIEDLRTIIRSVMRGELLVAPEIAASMFQRLSALRAGRPSEPALLALTFREREILRLVSEGMSNKGIAAKLGISLSTAKNHVHHILDKLSIHRRVDAASLYRRRLRPSSPQRVIAE